MAKFLQNKWLFTGGKIVYATKLPVVTVFLGKYQELNLFDENKAPKLPFVFKEHSGGNSISASAYIMTDIVNGQLKKNSKYVLYTNNYGNLEDFTPINLSSFEPNIVYDMWPLLRLTRIVPRSHMTPVQYHLPFIKVTLGLLEGANIGFFKDFKPWYADNVPHEDFVYPGDYIQVLNEEEYTGLVIRKDDFSIEYMLE